MTALADPRTDEIALWADERALTQLLARLSRAIDRSDQDAIAACYTDDSVDHHGSFLGTGAEFADYICGGSPISKASESMIHCLGQSLFDIRGDEAFGETAFMFDMAMADGGLYHGAGRYVDHFVRVGGRWLLHYRRVVADWQGLLSTVRRDVPESGARSRRDRTDPVYDERRAP